MLINFLSAQTAEILPKLKGWAAVERYVRRHDEGMIKDLDRDIDTLLVFVRR